MLRKALCHTTAVSKHAEKFDFKSNFTTADKVASIRPGVKRMMEFRDPGWQLQLFACDIHVGNTAKTKTSTRFRESISGINYIALSTRDTELDMMVQQACDDEIADTIVVLDGDPPVNVTNSNLMFIELFMGGEPVAAERQVILHTLPNGDWRKHDRV